MCTKMDECVSYLQMKVSRQRIELAQMRALEKQKAEEEMARQRWEKVRACKRACFMSV